MRVVPEALIKLVVEGQLSQIFTVFVQTDLYFQLFAVLIETNHPRKSRFLAKFTANLFNNKQILRNSSRDAVPLVAVKIIGTLDSCPFELDCLGILLIAPLRILGDT